MPVFYRDNANFIAPPMYALSGGGQPFGHSPIDISLVSFSANWIGPGDVDGGLPNTFQLWVDGAVVGPVLSVPSGVLGARSGSFDPAIDIPAVSAANVDGASRFGVKTLQLDDTENVAIFYRATNAADVGKQVWGIGSNQLVPASQPTGVFGPIAYQAGGTPGGWSLVGAGDIFANEAELNDSVINTDPADVSAVAAIPWCRNATWDDFMVVLRAAPTGTTSFHLRINGATVKTLTVTAGATRVWTYPGTVTINRLDQVCWQEECDGEPLDGEILWTSRAAVEETGEWLGGGESGG